MSLNLFQEVDAKGNFTLDHNVKSSKPYIETGDGPFLPYNEFGYVRATQGLRRFQHNQKTNNLGFLQPSQTQERRPQTYNMRFEKPPKVALPDPAYIPLTNSEIEARNVVLPDGVPVANLDDFTKILLQKPKIKEHLAIIAAEHQALQAKVNSISGEEPVDPADVHGKAKHVASGPAPEIKIEADGEMEVKEQKADAAVHDPSRVEQLLGQILKALESPAQKPPAQKQTRKERVAKAVEERKGETEEQRKARVADDLAKRRKEKATKSPSTRIEEKEEKEEKEPAATRKDSAGMDPNVFFKETLENIVQLSPRNVTNTLEEIQQDNPDRVLNNAQAHKLLSLLIINNAGKRLTDKEVLAKKKLIGLGNIEKIKDAISSETVTVKNLSQAFESLMSK